MRRINVFGSVLGLTIGALSTLSGAQQTLPEYITLNADLGGVAVEVPFNRLTLIVLQNSGESLNGGHEFEDVLALASASERLELRSVSYGFSRSQNVGCAGPDWLVEACDYARQRPGISVSVVSIAAPAGEAAMQPPHGQPAADGSLTRTDLGRHVSYSAIVNGRALEALCLPSPGAQAVDFICQHGSSDGQWNWSAQIGVAEEHLNLLPETMAWVGALVDQIKTSEGPK